MSQARVAGDGRVSDVKSEVLRQTMGQAQGVSDMNRDRSQGGEGRKKGQGRRRSLAVGMIEPVGWGVSRGLDVESLKECE